MPLQVPEQGFGQIHVARGGDSAANPPSPAASERAAAAAPPQPAAVATHESRAGLSIGAQPLLEPWLGAAPRRRGRPCDEAGRRCGHGRHCSRPCEPGAGPHRAIIPSEQRCRQCTAHERRRTFGRRCFTGAVASGDLATALPQGPDYGGEWFFARMAAAARHIRAIATQIISAARAAVQPAGCFDAVAVAFATAQPHTFRSARALGSASPCIAAELVGRAGAAVVGCNRCSSTGALTGCRAACCGD